MEKRMVLITMTGQDQPGIIAAVTEEVAAAGARIRDIEQTVTHTLLSLSLLIDFSTGESASKPLIKDLLFLAKELGLDLDFQVLSEAEYRRKTTRHAYVVTIMGGEVNALALARVSRILADHGVNIERVSKLTQGQLRCVEFLISTPPELDVKALTRKLLNAGASLGVDIAVQKESLYRRAKRLVVMDMDSTLIQIEVIDELARIAGVGPQVAAITERAMNGELDFDGSLRARVALLKGMPAAALEEVYRNIPLTPGARTLVTVLKRLGFRTAVISGGFRFFTDRLQADLGLDYAFANQLEIIDGVVTGNLVGQVVDGARKAQLLEEIAAGEGITLDQTIAIGDGANDLPMLGKAGLGIAFNAKARVREQADTHINQQNLDSILYLLGLSERETAEIAG
ncbi:phosphoserine phosphatase SerB [Desulfuromonas carbonis]|uniref:phosphoserine phosphatase SerB n=1 Tax=Desulfuromonas sp. DDH964 TaxID=1823759 RepID=UPI00078CEDE9|nr:phosphoserine phosphatase SerB [Desulfuromonas sp. DDH964]AMV73201.1 Phosphoserine phosphatase [Desulfuromonas sp. DDH964]